MLILFSILFVMGTTACSPYWNTQYQCFRFVWRAFFCTIFLIINVHLRNEMNLDTHYNLHSFLLWVLQSCSPYYWCFEFATEAFLSSISPVINVHSWNESNMDTRNNPYSFCYGLYYYVLPIRIHDINALDLQEKLFPPPFSI